jgi:hypothetical protein
MEESFFDWKKNSVLKGLIGKLINITEFSAYIALTTKKDSNVFIFNRLVVIEIDTELNALSNLRLSWNEISIATQSY